MNRYALVLMLLAFGQVVPAQTKPDNNLSPKTRIYEPKYLNRERGEQVARFVHSIVFSDNVNVAWEPLINGLVMTYTLNPLVNTAVRLASVEALDRAEALIKRFDVPEPAPPPERQIEMTVNLIRAWTDNRPAGTVPTELAPVVKEMKGALPYAGFTLVDTIQSLIHDGLALQDAMPNDSSGAHYFYSLSFNGLKLSDEGKSLWLGTFHFGVKVPVATTSGGTYQDESITTPLTIREGQKLVLGKIKLHNDDLFVVLSYKLK
jgi:hypothetical protein